MTPEELGTLLARRLPRLRPFGEPTPLAGGLLNLLWRVPSRGGAVVVKHAPPHIASVPEVALGQGRMVFESGALTELAPDGRLGHLSCTGVAAPRVLHFDAVKAVLVMEDLGDPLHLGEALVAGERVDDQALRLGRFIGRLHATTIGDPDLAATFDNRGIQRTRHEMQYLGVEAILRRAGIADAAPLGMRAAELGQRLLQPGHCLVMGDLWPPSVLLTGAGVYVIDWEFVHFGQPAQDLGHLAAHLWMLRHRAADPSTARRAELVWRCFVGGYSEGASDRAADLLDAATRRDTGLHMAAEILVRAAGPFQAGGLYDGLTPTDGPASEAVAAAAALLRDPDGALPRLLGLAVAR